MEYEKCKSVASRIKHDKRNGNTTSGKVIEFIRRTCACEHCRTWRDDVRKAKAS